jgi:subtilase family serine protease
VNRRLAFAAAAALAIALAACSGGGGGGSSMPSAQVLPPNNSTAAIPPQLLVQSYDQNAMAGATYIGPVSGMTLNISVLVHQQNAQGMIAYAQAVQNPASGSFRRFLTPDQIATQFGAKQSDYQAVAQYFADNGLAVAGWKQRLLLSVTGPQASMERALGTTFGLYEANGQKFIAPSSPPHFLQQLPVDQIGGIVRLRTSHTYIIVPPRANAGYTVGYSPSTVRAAFDYIGAYNAGYDGAGINLGIIGTGPIHTTSVGHGDVDLNAYLTQTDTTNAATVTQVDVSPSPVAAALAKSGCGGTTYPSCTFPYSSAFQTPPPVTAPCTPTGSGNVSPGCNPEDGEAQLDTQQTATLAPGANILFYLAYNASDCNVNFPGTCPTTGSNAGAPEIGIVEADPEIMQAINDNVADVLSISYGDGEPQQGWQCYTGCSAPYLGSYSNLEFAELATEGIAVFVSSGDDGSAECFINESGYLPYQCVSYPAGDPSVTSVGGITAPVNAYGQATGPWVAWGITTFESQAGNTLGIPAGYGALGGSGGGASNIGGYAGNPPADIPAPMWQQTDVQASYREQPDVSMLGDPSTGVSTMENYGFSGATFGDIGGTSVAAPQMAAMWADVLSACKLHVGSGMCPSSGYRLGNAAPYLYAIYKDTAINDFSPSLSYNQVFYDIVYGDNQMANPSYGPASPVPGASAGPGYDMVSGIGVPFAGHLIDAITGLNVP